MRGLPFGSGGSANTAPSLTAPAAITGVVKTTPVTFTATATDPDTINPGAVPNALTFMGYGGEHAGAYKGGVIGPQLDWNVQSHVHVRKKHKSVV